MTPLRLLHDHGQSVWLDNLTRDMVRSGDLARRIEREAIRGVTSNPAIFHKAISGGATYDEQIADGHRRGLSAEHIYEELVTTDVREACDVFRPVWERSDGADGYVSLEVSPHLARDTKASLHEARRLHATVDRPNLLIKIPGTAEGFPVIEQLIHEGIDVNVTLLFSIKGYESSAEAYLKGLERRIAEGKAIERTTSVASFFLSRIDTLVDKMLDDMTDGETQASGGHPRPQDLMGRVAVANARLAYQRFLELLDGKRWQTLSEHGAKPQRMLWASTSTKNRKYSDVMYVEPLIGPNTVNTMPDETVAAFGDHGRAEPDTVTRDVDEAHRVMEELGMLGIDFGEVARQLEEEGIRKFVEPYDALLELIAGKQV